MLLLCAAAHGWPHFLLADNCAKGLALVAGGSLPRIMNVIPTQDPSALEVFRHTCDGKCDEALVGHESVPVGTPLALVYSGLMGPDTRTAFVSSQGTLHEGEPCGDEGGSLLTSGWLRHAIWTPTQAGIAQVAVGFAHGNFGTPAVTVSIKTLRIVSSGVLEMNHSTDAAFREDLSSSISSY
mmetsp:Transcript_6674/g.11562  ORF Transcript_6674/g.11562 Transcript_6674/m.11562 type:complete len:182 (-) Transcript_6674:94-639(-)